MAATGSPVWGATLAITSCLLVSSCLRAPPEADVAPWEADCGAIEEGRACLSLEFSLEDSIREDAGGPMQGDLHWAVYRGGDVGLFGPGDHDSLYDGKIEAVDLAAADAIYEIHLKNVDAKDYQVLAFLDRDGDGESSGGDPVTFPSEAFGVRAGLRTRVTVLLDYVR